jgi:dodecin
MVFKYIDILGESTKGFEEAVQNAIAKTSMTVKDTRWAENSNLKIIVPGDKIAEYQALMRVAFKVRGN